MKWIMSASLCLAMLWAVGCEQGASFESENVTVAAGAGEASSAPASIHYWSATQPVGDASPTLTAVAGALGAKFQMAVDNLPGGQINWTTGQVVVVGTGRAKSDSPQDIVMAKRAARVVAARNAILAMRGVRAGREGAFKNLREGEISGEGVLRCFSEKSDTFDKSTSLATVTLLAPLNGISTLTLMKPQGGVSVFELAGLRRVQAPRPTPDLTAASGADAAPSAEGDAHNFLPTSETFVIDARGTGLVPSAILTVIRKSGPDGNDSGHFTFGNVQTTPVYVCLRPGAKLTYSNPNNQVQPRVMKAIKTDSDSAIAVSDENYRYLLLHRNVSLDCSTIVVLVE